MNILTPFAPLVCKIVSTILTMATVAMTPSDVGSLFNHYIFGKRGADYSLVRSGPLLG